jgi:hypothetical protein
MLKKRSPIAQRREQITKQLIHLRSHLSLRTRQDYTTDFRYEVWLRHSQALIDELLDELSILDEPGEYNELPIAIVADELGLPISQVKTLIRLGEIEITGKRAHERVSRIELERLTILRTDEILRQSKQDAESIFSQVVAQLRSSDVNSAGRSCRRLKARQSVIGNYALATEIAIQLLKGLYQEAERVIKFIIREKFEDRVIIGTYLTKILRDVCFQDGKAKAETLRLLKLLGAEEERKVTKAGLASDELQHSTMYIATVVSISLEKFISRMGGVDPQGEFYRLVKDGILSALYAEAYSQTSLKSKFFILSTQHRMPHYWEPARIFEELYEE